MASREEWEQAYEYMKNGGELPEYLKRLFDEHPHHVFGGFGRRGRSVLQDVLHSMPNDIFRGLKDNLTNQQYINAPLPDPQPPLVDATNQQPDAQSAHLSHQDVLDFIDKIPGAPTFPTPPPSLRFTSGIPLDQLRAASKSLMDQWMNTPKRQAAYTDEDGRFEEWTEPLEEWDGELCMTCGASWVCEHKIEHT